MRLNEHAAFPFLLAINAAIYIFGLELMTMDNPVSVLIGAFVLTLISLIEAKIVVKVLTQMANKAQSEEQ